MRDVRDHKASWRELMRPALVVWAIYIVLVPLYIFESGLPQPGDVYALLLLPVALSRWDGRLAKQSLPSMRPLIWFTVWVCIVDYGWALILGNFGLFGMDTFLLFPVYYIYNTLIFLSVLVMFRRYGDAFLRITLYAIYVTLLLQVGASFVFGQSTLRGSLFFNNPNQLGYYCLLCACVIVLLHWRLKMALSISALALTSCGYLALLSVSRASVAGILILLAVLTFSRPRVIILVGIAAGLLLAVGPLASLIDSKQERIVNRVAHVGFAEERGYDRIWKYKEHLVFGAGEGGLSRFAEKSRIKGLEIHSGLGMVLFSYGIVGMTMFVMFMYGIVRGATFRMSLVLVPPLIYMVAHQGLRFTMLWVLLAIFVCIKTRNSPSGSSARVGALRP